MEMEMEMKMEKGSEKKETEKRRVVPKFGSFKPKPTAEPGPETRPATERSRARKDGLGGAERDRDDGRRDGERRRHERERVHAGGRDGDGDHRLERGHRDSDGEKERNRRRDREGERHRDRGRDRDGERRRDHGRELHHDRHERHALRHASKDPENFADLNNDLFVFDKRGDPLIQQYGTNDRSTVPSYYRFGAGRIIGSPGFLTIHRDSAQEQFSIRGPGEGTGSSSAFRDKALVAAAARFTSRRIKPSPDQALPSASDDYIPLGPSRKRKRSQQADSPPPPPPPNYRSIHGKAKPSDPNPDSDSDSDSDLSSPSSPSPTPNPNPKLNTPQTRFTALSHHVKAHPSDIPAWLALIALQDTLFAQHHPTSSSSSSSSGPRTADERRALAELKLALYQEALPHAVAPGDRERLVLGMMREGGRVWGEGVLVRRWDEVCGVDGYDNGGGGGFGLWRARLDFEMGRVKGFGFERVRGLVVGKLRELVGGLVVIGVGGEEEEEGEEEELCRRVVYVFLRLARFLRDAGFGELAVAAWQAVLEMTFCRPAGEFGTAESALASFADFWESEVARIGEPGAKGWRHFVEAGGDMADPLEARTDRPSDAPKTTDPFKAWAAAEQQAATKARMPARTLDEGTEDDPFRVVMFSDIKDFLVWFPPAVLPRVKPLLVDAYLVFCGLPPAGLSGEKFTAMLDDPFVAGRGQGLHLGLNKDDAGTTLDLSRREPEFGQQGGNMAISPEIMFSGHSWFRYLDKWSSTHRPGDDQVDASWVLGALRYLVRDCGMEGPAEYYLAMEWLNEPTGARKVARGLLKQYSSNIRLYNAYALVEWANEKPEVSHKVLSSATGLTLSPMSSGNQLLWNTWAWIHVGSGEKALALSRLCLSVDRDAQSPTVSAALLLKARSHFSSTKDYSLSSQQLETAAQYAESLMLLEYLVAETSSESASDAQGNITAALASVHAFSQELESRNLSHSPHHERLLQTAARLLYYHATHGPYRPSYLRASTQTSIRLFPRNTIFLALFAWAQPALRIDDPVRDMLRSLSLAEPHDSLGTRRFAIQHEAHVGSVHSVRAAFETALDSEACRGSVELWTRYVRFCCERRELRGGAREVFYRAVGACPWAREVYMLGFGVLGGVLGAAELRGVVNTMGEKGLRVHVDLEEFLGGWQRGGR